MARDQYVGDCETVVRRSFDFLACRVLFLCRYDELWMPLVAEISVGSTPPIVLPPLDIEWVWFCHTLNPVSLS